jgi:hypothetical protein
VGFDALRQDLRTALRQKYRSAPPPGAAAPVAVGKPAARPVDEVELATLLGTCGDPELAGLVRRWLPYSLISDPVCRAVIQVLAEEETNLMAALDDEGEECKTFAAQIVNAPQKVLESEKDLNLAKAAQDLVLRIWQRHLEARKGELSRRLQPLQGAERQAVLQEYGELLLDQSKVKQGWEKACPILDLYLHRFAEDGG